MRMILALILTLGLTTGGCAWFGGSSATEEQPAQPPQEQVAAPEPAPAPEVPAKNAKGKADKKAEKKAEKAEKAASGKKVVKTEAQIAAELDMVGHKLAAQAARTVMPSKSSKEVRQEGKDFVASYVDVDAANVTTEMRPGASGQYVGFVRYQEKVMECRGTSKQVAMTTASCEQVKVRNLNELIRFDGASWQY
jgi:hypothetical protein